MKYHEDQVVNQGKSPIETPDHLKAIELFSECDANGDGRLNWDEFNVYHKKFTDYNIEKYGGSAEETEEDAQAWYNAFNSLSAEDGISVDDLNLSAFIFAAASQ